MFNKENITKTDWLLLVFFMVPCFFFFYHGDIWGVGWDSLNYIFSAPLDFYENAKKIRGGGEHMLGTPYPPSIYLIFAAWLFPFSALGFIDSAAYLPWYYTYWLKLLTSLVYVASGTVFYRIARLYFDSRRHANYAVAAWLTMPLAIFSQFIFSQYDIFYVLLTLVGVYMFLVGRVFHASFWFGLAITFKYFPAFVFLPLLLLVEKRIDRLALYLIVFVLPTVAVDILYGGSPAFIEGVKNHGAIGRVFLSALDIGGWKIYTLFLAFGLLCGFSYFYDLSGSNRSRVIAYFWLVSSILPFLFIIFHPQWLMFIAPPIVLTSLLSGKSERFFLLDLVGMFFFVGAVSLAFQNNVDAAMFRGGILGVSYDASYLMANVFDRIKGHSLNVYLSGFWVYMILQIILKYNMVINVKPPEMLSLNYNTIRRSLVLGLAIYLVPFGYTIYKDKTYPYINVKSEITNFVPGELTRKDLFEQEFMSKGSSLNKVELLLATFARQNTGVVVFTIVDKSGSILKEVEFDASGIKDKFWHVFDFNSDGVALIPGETYKLQLASKEGVPGNAITWWAGKTNSYSQGSAIVNNTKTEYDFAFKLSFSR